MNNIEDFLALWFAIITFVQIVIIAINVGISLVFIKVHYTLEDIEYTTREIMREIKNKNE